MSDIILEGPDFDRFLSTTDRAEHIAAVKTNGAFVAAMQKAIEHGRESVRLGTFVDTTPPIGAKRLYGILPRSGCGSPAAMCMEAGGAANGAETMK